VLVAALVDDGWQQWRWWQRWQWRQQNNGNSGLAKQSNKKTTIN
jgi:hypothetical protein